MDAFVTLDRALDASTLPEAPSEETERACEAFLVDLRLVEFATR
jgi:hypothetical protein